MAKRRKKRTRRASRTRKSKFYPYSSMTKQRLLSLRNKIDGALLEKGQKALGAEIVSGLKAHAAKPRKPQLHLPNPWGA